MQESDEVIEYAPDNLLQSTQEEDVGVWKLLIVDDDEEVHATTSFALLGMRLCGRPLQLIHARSGEEAATILSGNKEIAVVLLDVVMESHDAGLRLIHRIREELEQSEIRIVLRTGQPGHAPELDIIRDYDINDYKTKGELTQTRLITTLTAAIRSYEQLHAINDNRRGLELIVASASKLMQVQTMNAFAREVLKQLSVLLGLSGDGLVCTQRGIATGEEEGNEVHIVAASGKLAGYKGKLFDQLREPADAAAIKDCISAQKHSFSSRHAALYLRERNQEAVVYLRSDKLIAPVNRQLAEVFAANITPYFGNVKLVERLNFIAYHDPLTGLPNRARFLLDLSSAGIDAARGQLVCLLDIVQLTEINNSLGHNVGDLLLIAFARRLAYVCYDSRIAHLGGDQFGLIGSNAQLAPERLLEGLAAPFVAGEHVLQIEVALGYCPIEARIDSYTLFKRADMALTQARNNTNARHVTFTPSMEERTLWRLDVIHRLRKDFNEGKLAVWYQPQFRLADSAMVGLEALARWPEGDGFVHPPEVFIPLAEDAGLISELGAWVLRQSCATYRRLQDNGQAPHHIAVNVSMPQFRQNNFSSQVLAILEEYQMPASALELEITESLLLEEEHVVLHNLQRLRAVGVRIAIDDFGTGYSSLAYLRQLPIDRLKIDRSFVFEIDQGKGDLFAETIIHLAQKLGFDTVAEGVETTQQDERLRALGCAHVQGFLYASPMPADALPAWLASFKTS